MRLSTAVLVGVDWIVVRGVDWIVVLDEALQRFQYTLALSLRSNLKV
jgi:hypothetical protein